MINSINMTENEFPETFKKLNELIDLIENTSDVSISGRKLVASLLESACDKKKQELTE